MNSAFAGWLQDAANLIEDRLSALLAVSGIPDRLAAAMQHAALGGGKRLRPAALFAAAEDNGTLPPAAPAAACAVELIHCYSLAHDDMPCMDDDDTRRGKPACHKAYGEGMALLAGDCLHSLAFETLAGSGLPPAACALLARAAGAAGMGGGQAQDIAGDSSSLPALEAMHRLKTGALFDCALRLGLMCRGDADDARMRAIDDFSREFGLLFQIANDLQDEQQDRRAGRRTYATLLPAADARRQAQAAKEKALAAAETLFPRLADLTHAVYP